MNPGGAVVVDGVIRSAPQTVKPPLQKKSNQPKKPTKTKPSNWGKPTRQTEKIKQNQTYNNMHRQTSQERGTLSPEASSRLQTLQYKDSRPNRHPSVADPGHPRRSGPPSDMPPPSLPSFSLSWRHRGNPGTDGNPWRHRAQAGFP